MVSGDILFFDCTEDEMDTNEKTELSKDEFKIFFFQHIAKELVASNMPWTSSEGESVSKILYNLLNLFKHDEFIYYKKYKTEESFDDDDFEPLEF